MIRRHTFDIQEVASRTADFTFYILEKFLEKGSTLLLLSGGSVARDVSPKAFHRLIQLPKSTLGRLHVAMVDERWGKPWHKESNMLLLQEVGVIDQIRKLSIQLSLPLVENGRTNVGAISRKYNRQLVKELSSCGKRSIGVFGVGSDGHTAGIKPQPKSVFSKLFGGNELVVGYKANDFTRITLTPFGIDKLENVIIYASGKEKQKALKQMLNGSKELDYRYPAIHFQSHPQAHLFTDVSIG